MFTHPYSKLYVHLRTYTAFPSSRFKLKTALVIRALTREEISTVLFYLSSAWGRIKIV